MSDDKKLDTLIRRWTSIGAGFGARPARREIDLERLLLNTARHASSMARLFIMAATWLNTYGDLIAKHRLKRLIRDEFEAEFHPTLGLLLDIAQRDTHPLEFQTVINTLRPAREPQPLFESEQRNAKMIARAERRASELSRRWGRWCEPITFKHDALRPASWIMARHPSFITRADFRGDLRASILASLRFDDDAGRSELDLAEAAGGSRAQVRSALHNLAMTGRIRIERTEGVHRNQIRLLDAA